MSHPVAPAIRSIESSRHTTPALYPAPKADPESNTGRSERPRPESMPDPTGPQQPPSARGRTNPARGVRYVSLFETVAFAKTAYYMLSTIGCHPAARQYNE